MTDREFKKLNRSELIEIIYQLQKNEQSYLDEIKILRSQLEAKNFKISNAGSIAEAAVSLSGIFAKAQEAADIYLDEIKIVNDNAKAEAEKLICNAEAQAEKIIEDANIKVNSQTAKERAYR